LPEAINNGKNPDAVGLGKLGGLKGGKARARKLSRARRKEIAFKVAAARWRTRLGGTIITGVNGSEDDVINRFVTFLQLRRQELATLIAQENEQAAVNLREVERQKAIIAAYDQCLAEIGCQTPGRPTALQTETLPGFDAD